MAKYKKYENKDLVGKEEWRTWECPKELYDLMAKWQDEAYDRFQTHTQAWYSKYVSIEFNYKRKSYKIYPGTLNIPEELLEIMEDEIAESLRGLGCTKVNAYGMID